jgi:hypothetical protein
MLDISHKFEFDFAKVICTDLLLWDHTNSLTVQEIKSRNLALFDKELMAKLTELIKIVIYGIRAIRVRASGV